MQLDLAPKLGAVGRKQDNLARFCLAWLSPFIFYFILTLTDQPSRHGISFGVSLDETKICLIPGSALVIDKINYLRRDD